MLFVIQFLLSFYLSLPSSKNFHLLIFLSNVTIFLKMLLIFILESLNDSFKILINFESCNLFFISFFFFSFITFISCSLCTFWVNTRSCALTVVETLSDLHFSLDYFFFTLTGRGRGLVTFVHSGTNLKLSLLCFYYQILYYSFLEVLFFQTISSSLVSVFPRLFHPFLYLS